MTERAPPGHIVYEVNVEVDAVLADDYRAWMDTHVREMVSLPGFYGAHVYNVLAPAPEAGKQTMSWSSTCAIRPRSTPICASMRCVSAPAACRSSATASAPPAG